MSQDLTLTEDDIKTLAQRGGMDLGDQQNFWEFYQATKTFVDAIETPVEVTGARDDGTALAALLTALEDLGLIVDGTTAT